jgi:hypothetical protein
MELPYPLRQKPDSTFGFTFLVDAYESSHMLAMPQTLGPVRLGAGRPELASRLIRQPFGCGYIVGGLLNGPLPARLTS